VQRGEATHIEAVTDAPITPVSSLSRAFSTSRPSTAATPRSPRGQPVGAARPRAAGRGSASSWSAPR
jgi:hypothetical protein